MKKIEKTVELKELIQVCKDYMDGKMSHEELNNWAKEKMRFVPYMSMRDKVFCVMKVLFSCVYEEDIMERFISYEMNKFWHIVLAYTNVRLDNDLLTEENYEIVALNCYDWIMQNIKTDYTICENLFKDITSYVNQTSIENGVLNLANTDFSKLIEADKQLIDFVSNNGETIKDLNSIFTNTNMNKIERNLSKQIISDINKKTNEK